MKVWTGAAALAAGAHLLPSVLTVPALHRRFVPDLSGVSPQPHVALTFDDGPDPVSTPRILDALGELDVRATFFVLGSRLRPHDAVLQRLADEGHELAVHCWVHTPHLLRAPWRIGYDVGRTRDAIREDCGVTPRFWRPPNGVITGAGLYAARTSGLRPVLWTADGRDWLARASAVSISERVCRQLQRGGVVLLHDSDVTSAPDSWRRTRDALPAIVAHCRERGWRVGPLREHWPLPIASRPSSSRPSTV